MALSCHLLELGRAMTGGGGNTRLAEKADSTGGREGGTRGWPRRQAAQGGGRER